jgi:hypothetical protein
MAILRDLYWWNDSGIVIAGFGSDEFLPSLRCFRVDAIVASRLRVKEDRGRRCDIKNTGMSASIVAFAQSDMVELFMNGIDTDYSAFVHSFVAKSFLDGYPAMLSKILEKHLSRRRRAQLLRSLRTAGQSLTQKLSEGIEAYARKRHSEPIIDIVNQLPKEELAAMAEALVNLTSFKRHVTRNAETVGGPIDVAVISRGDGFVWIKRKHYFTKDLNPHFLANYYMTGR